MRYGSICSGIEAASVAWEPLGWEPTWFSEIEPFPCAVLQHHYPQVPNLGDLTADTFIEKTQTHGPVDLIIGGTPCQSFSVAGLRGGLDDDRGNLALHFMRVVNQLKPAWVVWENVPGVLSSNGGRDFGAILGALAECGYGFAYRVLDAQFFGVPQRRRRVFVIGHFGDWRRAVAVLFERESLSGYSAPGRKEGQDIAPPTEPSVASTLGGGSGNRGWCDDTDRMTFIPVSNSGSENWTVGAPRDGAHPGRINDSLMVNARQDPVTSTKSLPLGEQDTGHAVAIRTAQTGANGHGVADEQAHCLDSAPTQAIARGDNGVVAVRRLTPRECERLQGFPDDWTRIPWRNKPATECPDGPRYRAIGNSMATPVVRWIGERIEQVAAL